MIENKYGLFISKRWLEIMEKNLVFLLLKNKYI